MAGLRDLGERIKTQMRTTKTSVRVLLGIVLVVGAAFLGLLGAAFGYAAGVEVDDWPRAVVVGLGILSVLALVVFLVIKARAYLRQSYLTPRLARVDSWAGERGLERTRDLGLTVDVQASPFDLGGMHSAIRSWGGRYRGQSVLVMHYLVDTGTSKHPERRVYTVVAATGNGDFPLTEAAPQRGFAAMAARVGQDLEVESAEFNRAWRVSSVDERVTHALFTPRVIERMVQERRHAVRTLWSKGVIVTVRRGAVFDAERLGRWLDFVTDLAELVPGFARTDGAVSGAPSMIDAGSRPTAYRKRGRSGTEMVLLLVALAALAGGGKLVDYLGPVVGVTVLLVGFVLAFTSTRIAGWIDRRRGKRAA